MSVFLHLQQNKKSLLGITGEKLLVFRKAGPVLTRKEGRGTPRMGWTLEKVGGGWLPGPPRPPVVKPAGKVYVSSPDSFKTGM